MRHHAHGSRCLSIQGSRHSLSASAKATWATSSCLSQGFKQFFIALLIITLGYRTQILEHEDTVSLGVQLHENSLADVCEAINGYTKV
eukprot:4441091-Amphidinium_carterae.1